MDRMRPRPPRRAAACLALAATCLALAGCGTRRSRPPATSHAASSTPAASSAPTTKPPAGATQSPFALRGVVEGFYGPTWSDAATRAVLAFMGAHAMNTFVYAPKFDPYQRTRWRQPYPAARLAQLGRLARYARAHGVHFVYSLSPGLSITYSSLPDRRALEHKLAQLRSAGVHRFMLSFDDIPHKLSAAADIAAYHGSLAAAQVSLVRGVYAHELASDARFRLIFTPTEYYGTKPDHYLRTLAGLPRKVSIVWTGPGVIAPTIQAAQARAFGAIVGRKPLIWYNYPVNDWTVPSGGSQPRDLFLGPVRGLAPDLGSAVAGILSNPMLQPYASQIPLATLARYLVDPTTYRGRKSWQAALTTAGGRAATALTTFASAQQPYPGFNSAGHYAWTNTDPALVGQEDALLTAYRGHPGAALASAQFRQLEQTFTAWRQAAPQLTAANLGQPQLAQEIAPWVTAMAQDGQAGLDALHLLQESHGGGAAARVKALAALRRDIVRVEAQPVQFGGFGAYGANHPRQPNDFLQEVAVLGG